MPRSSLGFWNDFIVSPSPSSDWFKKEVAVNRLARLPTKWFPQRYFGSQYARSLRRA